MERRRSYVAIAVCLLCCIQWIEGAAPVRSCPYGWVTVPGIAKCFSVSQDNAQKTWDDAQLNCIAQGGSLVTFQAQNEMNYILGQLTQIRAHVKNYHHWWTGLKNGSYANGAAFNPSLFAGKWAPGQPVYNATNMCVQNSDGKFVVSPCQNTFQSVCERSQDLPLLCDTDDGWRFHNDKCYKVTGKPMPWDGARKACEAMGAQLAYVADDATQASLTEMSRSNGHHFWIGLRLFSPTNWTWTNGSQLVQGGSSYWAPSQPGNIQGTKCVMIDHTVSKYTQNWASSSCNTPRAFACQDSTGTCPRGWRQVSDHCFRIFPQARLSFQAARKLCEAQGAQLGMLRGPGDSRVVRSYMHEMHDVGVQQIWIGLTDANHNQGQWVWMKANGTVPMGPYSNWAGKSPSKTPNKQDCAFLNTADTYPQWHATSDCSRPMAVLCQVDADAVIKPVTVPPSQLTCDQGWLSYKDSCFLLNEADKSWLEARQWCQGQQADLARVPDSDTQAFLASQLQNQGDYWIGLNDRSKEGSYVWLSDTTNSTYYNWFPGEPNNAIQSNENCAAMMGTVGPPNVGKWHDISCDTRYNFICQKPPTQYITAGPSTTPASFPAECGLFWELNPLTRACYQFNDDQLTWADALDTCRRHGGDLLSIASAQEQFYITGRLVSVQSDVVWIGATDSTNEGGWTWTDGTPFAYFDWDAGEPNDLHEEDCGAIIKAKGKWNDFQCMYRAGYVCKKMSTLTTQPPPVTVPPNIASGTVLGCQPGWRGYRGWCYWYQDPGTAVSWSQAQTQCRQTQAELASVLDEPEHNLIFSLKPPGSKSMRAWIGLNDLTMEMSFQWSDGSPVTFTRWRYGEPNNYKGKEEDCVAISLYDGNPGWVDKACDDSGVGSYVCKQPKTVVPAGNQLNTLGCQQGSEGFQGWCFTFVTSAMTWQAAESNCQKLGGHLVTSGRNYQVQMFLSAMLATRGGNYWVGLSDVTTPGNYTWSSGAKLPFTYWSSNHTGKETGTCVAMTTTPVPGRWQNWDCGQQQLSVCETPRQGYTTPSPALPTPPATGTCPPGWTPYQSWCYMATNLTQSQRATWMEARDTCQGYGGSLASIHDDQTNAFLAANVLSNPGNYWIGLSDRDREASHEWVDASPYQFSKWAQGQPDDLNNQEDCVAVQQEDGTWWDNNCYIVLDFLCQIRPGTVIATTPPPPSVVTCKYCCPILLDIMCTEWPKSQGYNKEFKT